MIKWITKEQAEKAGRGTQLEAAQSSWERWNQAATCERDEIIQGIVDGKAVFSGPECGSHCALCHYRNNKNTVIDCLVECGGSISICTCEYNYASDAFIDFKRDLSPHNFMIFQTKAKALCVVIKKFMDGLEEKKELRHGDCWANRTDGKIEIFLKEYNGEHRDCIATDSTLFTNIGSDYDGHEILGNLETFFGDIARNAEDLREFRYHGPKNGGLIEISINHNDRLDFTILGNTQNFTVSEAQEIHQKLGQVIATALRDKKKGK